MQVAIAYLATCMHMYNYQITMQLELLYNLKLFTDLFTTPFGRQVKHKELLNVSRLHDEQS